MIPRYPFVRQATLIAAVLFFPVFVTAQTTLTYPPAPVPVDRVAATMKVPDGFKVTLFAAEPDVVQPIAFTFDDRGRMWVAECLSYPKWTKDGTGRDRIVILEDTDGDGVHDKRKVFADNLANLSGLEYGFGGVFICSLPTLKFIPDRDGDDVPDGPAETLLDGWDENCRHNVFNGLAWGPDGWLYGLNGILSRSSVGPPGAPPEKRKYLDCGVWRYHPTRRNFEPVASGTTNPWGLDWDDYGEMFITNCVIKHLFHVVPGGHYERMFGADPNPHVYGLMQSCADHIHWAGGHWTDSRGAVGAHSDAGGGHAHSGCSVYLGDNFPAEYRNNVFMCNIHGNRLNRDRLERHGSGYVAKHEPDFLFANDPWHRGLVVKYGPDGGLYVADWCDTGECHNYDVADVTNGRIVRVTYGMPNTFANRQGYPIPTNKFFASPIVQWPFDLQKATDSELISLQCHRNDWFVRHARRILQERAHAKSLGDQTIEGLKLNMNGLSDIRSKLRFMWALHAVQGLTDVDILRLMTNKHEQLRGWSVTLYGDQKRTNPNFTIADEINGMILYDSSPLVRRHLASFVIRSHNDPYRETNTFALQSQEDAYDENIPLLSWYAAETLISAPSGSSSYDNVGLELLKDPEVESNRRFITKRAMLDALKSGPDSTSGFLEQLFDEPIQSDGRGSQRAEEVLDGILLATQGLHEVKPPQNWPKYFASLSQSESRHVREAAQRIAVLFGDQTVLRDLETTLVDIGAEPNRRRQALELLVGKRTTSLPPTLVALLDDDALRTDSLRAVAAYDDKLAADAVIARFAKFTDAEKADALQTLASRPSYALALLDAVEAGTIDRRDVPSGVAQQIAGLKNKEVAERLAVVWGAVRPTSEARKKQAERLKQVLAPSAVAAADAKHGRELFTKSCAACHKLFGEGGKIGPELTGSQRANVDYVLENVLDPSAKVGRLYQVTVLELTDGRVVQGVVSEENDLSLTVQTANEQLTIAKSDIDARQQTSLSLMPDGLFDKLADDEIRDLMAYLASQLK